MILFIYDSLFCSIWRYYKTSYKFIYANIVVSVESISFQGGQYVSAHFASRHDYVSGISHERCRRRFSTVCHLACCGAHGKMMRRAAQA